MADTLKLKKQHIESAAQAYKVFKERTDLPTLLSRREKGDKYALFLDAHVTVFDEYFSEISRMRAQAAAAGRPDPGDGGLSPEAMGMAKDIASVYGFSDTGKYFMLYRHDGQSIEDRAAKLDERGANLISRAAVISNAPFGYMTQARESYRSKNRTASMDLREVEEDAAPRQEPEAVRVVRAAREELNQASLDMIGARTRADIAALARTDAQRAHQKARDEVDRIKALIKAADQAEAEVRKAQERLNLVYAHTGDTSSREYIRYWDLLEIARIKAEKARIKAIEARAILPQAEAEADLKARDLTVAQADADRTEHERTNAETNLAAKTRARDEKKTANPEAIRSYWKEDRNAGLTPAQNKGIRDISAFLYRNTLFGDPMDQYENGLVLDGILDHTPREKLLMFYLITEEKLQGNLKKEDLLASQTYVPDLDAFRPHMFAGWSRLKGVLGRVRGKSLDWDKLSNAAHMAEELMGEVNKLLRPRIPGAAGPVSRDPQMAVLIQIVVNLGNSLMANPRPSEADLKAFKNAVQALDDGIESRRENLWDKTKGAADEGNFWLAYVSKPLSMITSLLTEGGKSDSLGGLVSGVFAGGFSWMSVPAGTLGSLLSCITFLGGITDLVKTGRSGAKGVEITEQAFKLFNDTLGTLSSIYGSVRGIAGLAGATWMGKATAVGFAGGAGAVLGGLVMGHAAFSGVRAKVQEGHITDYKDNTLANFRPTGVWSQEQLDALDAQKDMLSDIADSSLDSARRRKTAAIFEGTAGMFGTIAGGLVAGGVTAFAAVPFSAAAFVVGIWGTVKNYKLKKASKNDVIDRYIGMDGPNGIYARYKADNTKPGSDFHEQFGTEEEVKDRLRWRAVRLQGFTSEDKMHAFIMQKYAVALYKGAFLKQDGSTLMAAEEEDTMNNNERANRILFTELIRDLGFKIKYPQKVGDSPVPAANAIYKKLMA